MSDKTIGVGMIGCGTVGGGVAELLCEQAALYTARTGARIELRRVPVRTPEKLRGTGVIAEERVTSDPDAFFGTDDMDVVIEVAGGTGVVGDYIRRALSAGKHVVTANKSLLAAQGPELFALARENKVSVAFEASCGGGIPCITALTQGLMANENTALFGILNGTCNYILSEMTTAGKSYAVALKEAQDAGFAEADPTLDVSGADTAQKLAILASLAFGVRIDGNAVGCSGIDTLELSDIQYADEMGYDVKLLGIAERDPATGDIAASAQPCFVHKDELLAQVRGSFNALSVYGHAVGHTMYYGAGAGAFPTASAVVSDLLNIVSGAYPTAFNQMRLTPDQHAPARLLARAEVKGRFYLRMNALDQPGVMARVSELLGTRDIGLSAIMQHEAPAGSRFVPLVIMTHTTTQGAVEDAMAALAASEVVEGQPAMIRVLDSPA